MNSETSSDDKQSEMTLLKDRQWSEIDGELCLVIDFKPLNGSSVKDGIIISPDTTSPYASITIKCRENSENINGLITHKMEFANLWAAFKERGINEEKEEVLIYWTAKHYKYKLLQIISNFFLTTVGAFPFPKLIVMVCPKGTYKSCPDGFPLLPKQEVRVFVYGLMSISYWIPDVIK